MGTDRPPKLSPHPTPRAARPWPMPRPAPVRGPSRPAPRRSRPPRRRRAPDGAFASPAACRDGGRKTAWASPNRAHPDAATGGPEGSAGGPKRIPEPSASEGSAPSENPTTVKRRGAFPPRPDRSRTREMRRIAAESRSRAEPTDEGSAMAPDPRSPGQGVGATDGTVRRGARTARAVDGRPRRSAPCAPKGDAGRGRAGVRQSTPSASCATERRPGRCRAVGRLAEGRWADRRTAEAAFRTGARADAPGRGGRGSGGHQATAACLCWIPGRTVSWR
jgi:hypothetical protein